MIGGDDDVVAAPRPDLPDASRPGVDDAQRTPGRAGDPTRRGRATCTAAPAAPATSSRWCTTASSTGSWRRTPRASTSFARERRASAGATSTPRPRPCATPSTTNTTSTPPQSPRSGAAVGHRLVAPRPHRQRPAEVSRPRRVLGARLGLRRGTLDLDRRDRRGRAHAGAHHRPLLTLRLPRPRRLRRQGALRHAQGLRRSRGEARELASGVGHAEKPAS